MRILSVLLVVLFCSCAVANAQARSSPPYEISGGYSWLSNSFNGEPGYRHPLSGWNADAVFPPWHHLRFRIDYSMYRGVNRGNPQHAFFILGGAQYEAMVHRERFYAIGLLGEGGLNGTWFDTAAFRYKNGNSGMIASLAEFVGGGVILRLARIPLSASKAAFSTATSTPSLHTLPAPSRTIWPACRSTLGG